MKLMFKFWKLPNIEYNKELNRVYPFIYAVNEDTWGIAFTNVSSEEKYPRGILRYKLKKLG